MGLRQPFARQRHLARRPLHAEADIRPLDVGPRELGGLQPLHLLAARRRLARARAGAEPGDEVVQLRDLLLALRVLGLDLRPDLGLGHDHVVVAAGIGDDRLVVDVGDVRADLIQEVPIVGDDDERALVANQELLQPVDRLEVEVVRRLVEQQRFGPPEERLGERGPASSGRPAVRPSPARAAHRECRAPGAAWRRRSRPSSRPPRRRCPRARRAACRPRPTARALA